MTVGLKAGANGTSGTIQVGGVDSVFFDTNGLAADIRNANSLTHLYHPTLDGAYRDLYRAGWLPSWFNQQWGGSQWGGLPDGSFGSVATGNVQDDSIGGIGNDPANYYIETGFKVSESATYDVVWVKLYKVLNPATLTVRIWSDSAGAPGAAIGAAATLSCKLITSKTDGEWYQISGLAAALTAGTQYHLVLTLTGTSGTDYLVWKRTNNRKYPAGNYSAGTSVPVWTPNTALSMCFLIQNPAANALIQSAGMFDYKLAFNNGSPVNQSRSLAQPLVNFYDGKNCTVAYRGTFALSTNVWDFCYGLDHDRITLTVNASGFPVLSIYESDRTLHQVTGTGSVTTGVHDVAIRIKTEGAGADVAYLYVDGVSVGTPLTAQTFTLANELRDLGTARLGDGFGLTPTWTQDMQMTALPSTQGWTWTGTGTEANCMSIQNNLLYQNANGYTSTQTGYYSKTTTFSNATGWAVKVKVRVPTSTNTAGSYSTEIIIFDGAKQLNVYIAEYWLQTTNPNCTHQADFKSKDCIISIHGKGSDYYIFIDGKLAIDGTGKLIQAAANNAIWFGDGNPTAGENADAIWHYVKYYEGGILLPVANTGTCSEFAYWSGDKSALLPYAWNSGAPVSIKQLCGLEQNYVGMGIVQSDTRVGITVNPTYTSTSYVLLADMESYSLGGAIQYSSTVVGYHNVLNYAQTRFHIDGVPVSAFPTATCVSSGYTTLTQAPNILDTSVALHKVELRIATQGPTFTEMNREITVETRS